MKLSETQLDVLQRMGERYTLLYLRAGNKVWLLQDYRMDLPVRMPVRMPTLYALMDKGLITVVDDREEDTVFEMTSDGEQLLAERRPLQLQDGA